ncbi:MAG: F0F1 ATP synthase subunit B [Crocinitomicaceae bacterium]|jgi:F-type H+-transporting ATPase subunit b|nr:F0F1 ATP synthase subunit B [Crocinitomicaceae bacterium]
MGALLTPAFGTVVWASIAFLVVMFLLRRFAWGPILSALSDREQSIAGALSQAEKVRQEMADLSVSNENQMKEARAERDRMMREAREMADQMVADAKNKAKEAADKEVASAKDAIAVERKAAIAELKAEVGGLSLEIAERLLREKLESTEEQKALVNRLIDESPLN